MQTIKVRITGTTPLIMNSDRGCNPMLDAVKAHKEITGKRKKTDEDHAQIARNEWELAMYFDPKIGPYMPAMNMRAALVGGAKFNKLGQAVKRSTTPMMERLPVEYDGPRTLDTMFKRSDFVDCRSVGVNGKRIMRTRPIFQQWGFDFELAYDEQQLDEAQLILAFENAGLLVGIGDYRPECGGLFGRFSVEWLA